MSNSTTETMATPAGDSAPVTAERQRLALAAAIALLGAGLVLVMFVLPAEYAVDPLGTGARFGLTPLGETAQQVAALEQAGSAGAAAGGELLVAQEKPFQHESVSFTLAPKEWVEYKYRLDKGEALLYSWQATAPVNVEFHAEPDGAPRGYAQTYEKLTGAQAKSGTLTAPFPGIHGWWFENGTDAPVTLTLSSSGFYNLSHEFHDGQPTKNKTY